MRNRFPSQQAGVYYLSEGGPETELNYKFGFDLPEFAMYPLLDNPAAVKQLEGMFRRFLDVAVKHQFIPLMGGVDYRASPDWAEKLGYDAVGLAEMQRRSIELLRVVAEPYRDRLTGLWIAGIIGPRGDAYQLNRTITADEAQEYHAVQIANLKAAGVDFVSAMTLNNIPEALGIARAAAAANLPLCIHFTLDSSSRLQSGPSLKEAIETIDAELGEDERPDFYGINCSHPAEFGPALTLYPGAWIERIRSLRPNAAMMDKISLCQLGHLEAGDPTDLGKRMADLARRYPHIDIWGGCCGTWEDHLEQIATQVEAIV